MSKKQYTALTIGPIFDTMSFASKPGALWTASYMFSYLTRCLCVQLVEHGLPEENIITPYFTLKENDPGYPLLNKNDGVGLFHDRIIFIHDDGFSVDLNSVKAKALSDVYTAFGFNAEAREYLDEYILIADATFDSVDEDGNNVNPIFMAGIILDSLELSKTYTHKSIINPLLSVFVGSTEYQNEEVKNLPAVGDLDSWQLWRNSSKKQLKSLGDIATGGKHDINSDNSQNRPKKKKYYYYAIVRSDGDNMSSVISGLGNDSSKIRDFSMKCLDYCSKIAETVFTQFGGVTVYSGGDDLLAILPCESADGNTVYDYIDNANEIFKKCFPDEKSSLSFGITICHYKYPLYEAIEESATLLFDVAKSSEHGKNCAAINLHKHSGQTSGIVIKNDSLKKFLELQNTVLGKNTVIDGGKEDILLSVLYKLSMFEDLFLAAERNETGIKNLFVNCFDDTAHKTDFVEITLPEFYIGLINKNIKIKALVSDCLLFDGEGEEQSPMFKESKTERKDLNSTNIKSMCSVLRMLKFLVESAGEN